MICKIHPQGLCVFTARMATATSSVLRVIIIVNFTLKHLTWTTYDVYYLEPHVLFFILSSENQVLLAFVLPALLSTNGLMAWSTTDSLAWLKWVCSCWWGALMSGILAIIFKWVKWVGRWCRKLWLDHPTTDCLAWHDFSGTFPICGMLEGLISWFLDSSQ